MGMVIMPYTMASESAKILADKLKCFRIRREKSKYKHKENTTIINWGCPERPEHIPDDAQVLNQFDAVKRACNKITAFSTMMRFGISTPEITEDTEIARMWLGEGKCVLARTVLNGHGGKGIVIMESEDDFVEAPLYTKYIPKKSEWRVHVFRGEVIDATRKVLKEGHPDRDNVNWKVRNHDNGFIFQRYNPRKVNEDGSPLLELYCLPSDVTRQAVRAVNALGLTFGAADVIYNAAAKKAFVLEVNTAPGMAETTSDIYAQKIREFVEREEEEDPIPFPEPPAMMKRKPFKMNRVIVDPEWPAWPRP